MMTRDTGKVLEQIRMVDLDNLEQEEAKASIVGKYELDSVFSILRRLHNLGQLCCTKTGSFAALIHALPAFLFMLCHRNGAVAK